MIQSCHSGWKLPTLHRTLSVVVIGCRQLKEEVLMSKDESWNAFARTFPSDELLCGLFGVASYDEVFEQHFKKVARAIRRGQILAVYPSDVSISEAIESGELKSRKSKDGKDIFEVDKKLYRENCNLFKM